MPKKPRRSKIKYPSLIPRYNSRIRQEYVDIDYVQELNDTDKNVKLPNGKMVTEREYMALFMKEWNNAGVGKQSKPKENALHRSAEEIKKCTDRNNKRNNDVYGQMRAQGKLMKQDYYDITNVIDDMDALSHNETEDILIDIMDRGKNLDDTGDNSDDSSDDE